MNLDVNKQKEEFNYAYVSALAAHAGLNRGDFRSDDDSVDVSFKGRGYTGGIRNPLINIQLKCSSQDLVKGDVIKFPLSKKNYDDLRGDNVAAPCYLVVMLVPKESEKWVEHKSDHMALFHSCYWLSLRDFPEISNKTSVTVDIPLEQRLTTEVLLNMMSRASDGEAI